MKYAFFKRVRTSAVALALAATVGVGGLTGCADSALVAPEAAEEAVGITSKLRHANLMDRAVRGTGKTAGYVSLIVGLNDTVLNPQQVLERYQVLHRYQVLERYQYKEIMKGLAIEVADSDLKSLLAKMEADGDVRFIEPNIAFGETSPMLAATKKIGQAMPWSMQQIGATLSSTRSGDGVGKVDVDLVIIDTGVSSQDVNTVFQYDLVSGSQTVVADDVGHGTHVAGIAAAVDDADGIAGVAPGARVYNVKATGPYGTADLATIVEAVDVITSVKQAEPWRNVVVNISLGAVVNTTVFNALDEAITRSIAQGVVYVISAGNQGVNAKFVTPAHVPGAITVGAYDSANRFASFSNFGSMVDLQAPGVDILSLVSERRAPANYVTLMSGTSMAAAHVAGAAALLKSRYPSYTPQQVRDALVRNGRALVVGAPLGTTNVSLYVGGF